MSSVKVNSFIAASKTYAAAAAERANENGNAFLTLAEAKALPEDLRDNYARFQRGSSPVGVKSFLARHMRDVAEEATRADLNQDGKISLQELRLIPTHLRDNVANFGRMPLPPEPSPVDDISVPLQPATIDIVRSALTDYVETSLTVRRPSSWDDGYEYDSGDWADVVSEHGGDDAHDALKREMLELASSWRPDLPDWEQHHWSGMLELTGHFKQMRLFVQLEEGEKPSFVTEID